MRCVCDLKQHTRAKRKNTKAIEEHSVTVVWTHDPKEWAMDFAESILMSNERTNKLGDDFKDWMNTKGKGKYSRRQQHDKGMVDTFLLKYEAVRSEHIKSMKSILHCIKPWRTSAELP